MFSTLFSDTCGGFCKFHSHMCLNILYITLMLSIAIVSFCVFLDVLIHGEVPFFCKNAIMLHDLIFCTQITVVTDHESINKDRVLQTALFAF